MPFPSEQPLYLLHQKTSRAVLPKLITLVILSIIFYVGVLLNVNLLDLSASQETSIQIGTFAFLLAVVIIGIILAGRKAHTPYLFYRAKITHGKKEILYSAILNTQPQYDFLGKIFKTYSMNLGNDFHLRHISNETQIQDYIKQMIQYAQQRSF